MAKGSSFSNLLGGALVLGTVAYAVAAQMTTPPLEPARSFMRWQALWGHGTYGVKLTFVVTWMTILCVPLVPLVVVLPIAHALSKKEAQPAMPSWPRVEWARHREPLRALAGAVAMALAILFSVACLTDPEVFVPIGFLATILLIFAPMALVAGPIVLLDAVMPARVVVGPIEAVQQRPGASPEQPVRHVLRVGGRTSR